MKSTFLRMFQESRSVLCMCPHCNSFSRLSDLRLQAKTRPPQTWMDTYERALQRIRNREADFDEQENDIHASAIARARKKVPRLLKKSMNEQFATTKYNPYDIKALFHPVEFVVFDGMRDGNVSDVVLLSRPSRDKNMRSILKSIKDSVNKKRYGWRVARPSLDGSIKFE